MLMGGLVDLSVLFILYWENSEETKIFSNNHSTVDGFIIFQHDLLDPNGNM